MLTMISLDHTFVKPVPMTSGRLLALPHPAVIPVYGKLSQISRVNETLTNAVINKNLNL